MMRLLAAKSAVMFCLLGQGEGACPNMDLRVAKGMNDRGYDKIRVSVLTTKATEKQCDLSDAKWTYNEKFFSPESCDKADPTHCLKNKMSEMTLRTTIMTVNPGETCALTIGGEKIPVKTPAKGGGARGLLFADPCIRTVNPGPPCAHGQQLKIKERFAKAINALVASDELDFWGIIGDNFYDASGDVLIEFMAELSLEAKAKPFITVPGNHDLWNAGAPELGGFYAGVDHFGYGFMQYYAQDTVASLGNSTPFYFPKDPSEFTWPAMSKKVPGKPILALPYSGIPKEENFVFWYQIGNAAMFGYSGAHATGLDPAKNHDQIDPYVEKFCKWVGETDEIVTWMLFGHWNGPNLGCSFGMDTPSIYKVLMKKDGCAAKKGLYFDGHDHCNRITTQSTATDPLPVGYMIGGSGMSGDCQPPQSGFVVVDSKAKDVAVDYYDLDGPFDTLSACWDANKEQPFTKCRSHAQKWRDVPDTEDDVRVVRRMTSAGVPDCGSPAPPPGPPGPGPAPAPSPEASTDLSEPAKAGDTQLKVASTAGFKVGRKVVIDKGTPQEEANEISAFGSIMLKDPLKFAHGAGTTIEMPQEGGGGSGSNAMIYVGVAVAAVLIIAAIAFALFKFKGRGDATNTSNTQLQTQVS